METFVKILGWFYRKFNRSILIYNNNDVMVLMRTDNKTVFYDMADGKKVKILPE